MIGFISLFFEFFKIGLFSVGGGLATLPFLYELAEKSNWFDIADISNMVAISESTPGPLGINMATFVGFQHSGVLGSITAVLGLVFPSIIVILIVAGILDKFSKNRKVKYIFYGLRAASCALITSAGFSVFKIAFLNHETNTFFWQGGILALILAFILYKFKKIHPIFLIILSAVVGIIFKFKV